MTGEDKRPKSPFAALAALRDQLPEGPKPSGEAAGVSPLTKPSAEFAEKVIVARSKKGRGGKTVTLVTGVLAKARDGLASDLRKALGCGATVDGEEIVVQGDQVPRVRTFLEARGARKVIVGS
jgi:translation initiation factor 1